MIVGIPKEVFVGERRVALVPELVPRLIQAGLEVHLQTGAGDEAGFVDEEYASKGALLQPEVLGGSDILLKVRPCTGDEIARLRPATTFIGFLEPFTQTTEIGLLAERRVTAFAMELMPRIARAQPMDSLSAMSTVAGYKAVLLAANRLPKFFPLLMTAAGTMTPARVLVIGAGVAGLEAIGTAKRLGAVVEAYDPRPAVKEEVQSLGAKFLELGLDTQDAEEKGGYAKPQTEEFYRKQREMMSQHVAAADVVITAGLVRGERAPILVTEEMVRGMRPGSVIVDLAADQGGNCSLTEPGRDAIKYGVNIMGPLNLPSTMAHHASQMYARTVVNFLLYCVRDGKIGFDLNDELIRSALVTHQGNILHATIQSGISAEARPS